MLASYIAESALQGNCSSPPEGLTLQLDPPPKAGQCVVTVREDFLEMSVQMSVLWISNLYIRLPGVEKNHSTLIGIEASDVYLTDMTFAGDGVKARAVDVQEDRRVFIARALLHVEALSSHLSYTYACSACTVLGAFPGHSAPPRVTTAANLPALVNAHARS